MQTNIVRVKYVTEGKPGESNREYSYYTEDRLNVGDIIQVPVKDTMKPARVTAIDVPESEVAAFKDSLKTIPKQIKV